MESQTARASAAFLATRQTYLFLRVSRLESFDEVLHEESDHLLGGRKGSRVEQTCLESRNSRRGRSSAT
eukprot:6206244-Pleurochrysis_carterae.AAC.2